MNPHDASALQACKAQEPGLASNPEVISTKQKIAKLQADLNTEQGKLNQLVEAGTPFRPYQTAVVSAGSFISGVIQRPDLQMDPSGHEINHSVMAAALIPEIESVQQIIRVPVGTLAGYPGATVPGSKRRARPSLFTALD
jgi:hypothetical protein